jgi:hypothetical protein
VEPISSVVDPLSLNNESEFEVHILLCHDHVPLGVWSLMSWYVLNARRDRLFIHDDGTLQSDDYILLKGWFVGVRIIEARTADTAALKRCRPYPCLSKFRTENVLAKKLLDFCLFAESRRFVILDSDMLTFSRHAPLENWLAAHTNIFMADYQYAFMLRPWDFILLNAANAWKKINTGYGIVNAATLDLEKAERAMERAVSSPRQWWLEQTMYAILSAPFGIELMGSDYVVARGAGVECLSAKHYVAGHKELAVTEGIPVVFDSLIRGNVLPPASDLNQGSKGLTGPFEAYDRQCRAAARCQ